jgi:transcriptional regulator with XRE-family HTH domain
MYSLYQIRELLGFTQQEMASYLGIGPSHLAMAETGRRSLPVEANQRLHKLNSLLEQALELPIPDQVVQSRQDKDEDVRQFFKGHALICQRKAKTLAKELSKMVRGRDQNINAARLPESKKPIDQDIKTHELLLEVKRRESLENSIDYSVQKENMICLQIEMLEEEANRAEKISKNY